MAHGADRRELNILNHLAEQSKAKLPGSEYLLSLLDHFEYVGTEGIHLCLVFELMWEDVFTFLERYRDEPLETRLPLVKQICRKVALGLDALHRSGVIHNGMTNQHTFVA